MTFLDTINKQELRGYYGDMILQNKELTPASYWMIVIILYA